MAKTFLVELNARDPSSTRTTTNLCLQSENFGTTWTVVGTPTRVAASHTASGISLDKIGDDSAAAVEGYGQIVGFTGDAKKAISAHVKKDTSTNSLIRLFDGTAGQERLWCTVTWNGEIPVPALLAGAFEGMEYVTDGVWRLKLISSTVTAAHTHTLYVLPATTAAFAVANTGTLYAGGVQVEDATSCGPYVKTTTVAVSLTAPTPVTLRYSNGLGFTCSAVDGNSAIYDPRLIDLSFAYDSSVNQLKIGNGRLTLANKDGGLDSLLDYSFDAGMALVLFGDDLNEYSTFVPVAKWAMEQIETQGDTLSVRTRTPAFSFDRAFQTNAYTSTLTAEAAALNKPMAVGMGYMRSAFPTLIDGSKNMYHLTDDFLKQAVSTASTMTDTVVTLYDAGVVLTAGAAYTSTADMIANTPSAGQYRVLPAASATDGSTYFRLGSTPTGEITVLLRVNPNAGNLQLRALVQFVLQAGDGSLSTIIHADDFTDLVNNVQIDCGLYYDATQQPTYLEVLDTLLTSIWGWTTPYPMNARWWAVKYLRDTTSIPASTYTCPLGGPPAIDIVEDEVISISRVVAKDGVLGVPVFRVSLQTRKNFHPQTTGLAGSVSSATRALLGQPYQSITSEDLTVLDSYPTAEAITVDGALTEDGLASTQTEATRQRDLFSTPHDTFIVQARVPLIDIALTVPGDPATVTYPRYGCDSGRDFMILGFDVDFLTYDPLNLTVTASLTLWGAA